MKEKSEKKVHFNKDETQIVSFSNLEKIPLSSQEAKSSDISSQEKNSPRFASGSNNSFFGSPRNGKIKENDETLEEKNFSKTADSFFKPGKKDEDDANNKNLSPRKIAPYSPRHSHGYSYPYFLKKDDKKNAKE